RRPRKLHATEVVDFPLVELGQQLLAQIGQRVRLAENASDASPVRVGVPVSQLGWKPWVLALQAAQKSGIGASRQIASGKQCAGCPRSRRRAELARQHVDRALGELAVSGDLPAEYREERARMPVELERVVARDARGVRGLIIQQGPHPAVAPYNLFRTHRRREVSAGCRAEVRDLVGADVYGGRIALVLDIRRAYEREVMLIGNCKHDPMIIVLEEIGEAVREEARNDDVTALHQPDRMTDTHR